MVILQLWPCHSCTCIHASVWDKT